MALARGHKVSKPTKPRTKGKETTLQRLKHKLGRLGGNLPLSNPRVGLRANEGVPDPSCNRTVAVREEK